MKHIKARRIDSNLHELDPFFSVDPEEGIYDFDAPDWDDLMQHIQKHLGFTPDFHLSEEVEVLTCETSNLVNTTGVFGVMYDVVYLSLSLEIPEFIDTVYAKLILKTEGDQNLDRVIATARHRNKKWTYTKR